MKITEHDKETILDCMYKGIAYESEYGDIDTEEQYLECYLNMCLKFGDYDRRFQFLRNESFYYGRPEFYKKLGWTRVNFNDN